MRQEHANVPWYSSQLQAPLPTPILPATGTPSTADTTNPEIKTEAGQKPTKTVSTSEEAQPTVLELLLSVPVGPLPLPGAVPEQIPPLEETLSYVAEDDEDDESLTPEQEDVLLQAGDTPADTPGEEYDEAD